MDKYSQPSTFESLVSQYDHFIETMILRVSAGSCRRDDLPDLKQAVYLRLWQAYQPGSRSAYDPTRGAAFSTYLTLIIRSVCINQFQRNGREPVNLAVRLRTTPAVEPWTIHVARVADLRDEAFEDRAAIADVLVRFRVLAQATEDAAQLLSFYDACVEVLPTTRRLMKATGSSAVALEATRQRAVAMLAQLGVRHA